jgi:DNA-binding SARP family transcriptional activator
VEFRSSEGWRGIGAPKWLALLAVLLLNRGRVVSVERLIDELWREDPPAGARKLVSGYVGRLRCLLGDPDGLVLTTRPPGYQLLVSRDDVDASRFEDLLMSGRTALDGGDAHKADGLLGAALAIWRGPALADVPPGPVATAESERLEELRLSAVEMRCEAKLSSGQHDELVPDLLRLTADHPLRERLWHQLLRALNASGRPAEALEAYEHARKVLAEELGADPGPDLQRLYLHILADGPAPAARPAPGVPSVTCRWCRGGSRRCCGASPTGGSF